jgi:hypothetical protein
MECRGLGLLQSAQRREDLTTTAGLSVLGAIAATGITSRRAHRNSGRHYHHHEAMINARCARAHSCVSRPNNSEQICDIIVPAPVAATGGTAYSRGSRYSFAVGDTLICQFNMYFGALKVLVEQSINPQTLRPTAAERKGVSP